MSAEANDKAARKPTRVFLSHGWQPNDDYAAIVDLLQSAGDLAYEIVSQPVPPVPFARHNFRYLVDLLKAQFSQADVIVLLAGAYHDATDWVVTAMLDGKGMGKPIIVLEARDTGEVPAPMAKQADKVLGWDKTAIIEAIRTPPPPSPIFVG